MVMLNLGSKLFKMPEQLGTLRDKLSPDEFKKVVKGSLANPLKFFCPNGAQEGFIKTVARSTENNKVPIILATFANGVGKSSISINVILNFIYKPQNAWFDYPIFWNFPFPKTIWYASTAEAIKDTIVPEIERYAPSGTYNILKESKAHASRIIFNSSGIKWQLSFKTFDQDPKTFESANVGIFVADEPLPQELWKAAKSRRRKGCITMLPMTPLKCEPYVLDEVQEKAEEGVPGYFHLTADVYAGCKERGVRGHLDADIIDAMVDSYLDSEEIEARVFGKFMYFSGTIFPELDKDIHFVEPKDYPIPIYSKIVQVSDPHDGRPSAIIWGAKTPEGRIIIFDELPRSKAVPFWNMNQPIDAIDEVQAIFDKEEDMAYKPTVRVLDKRFGWERRAGTTLANVYKKAGEFLAEKMIDGKKPYEFKKMIYTSSYSAPAGEGEIAYGHMLIRRALAPLKDNKPGLVIWNRCYHTWNGLSHYIRQRRTGKSAENYAIGDGKIVEKYKDFPDAVRYLVCSDLSPQVPEASKTQHQKDFEKITKGSSYATLRDS